MTTIARIVERFTMQLPDAPERDAWFLDYVLRSPTQAGRHLTAGWLALNSLKDLGLSFRSCREYFGGMGAQALMVDELWPDLDDHEVLEFNREAVKHLELLFESRPPSPTIEVFADSYDPKSVVAADLVVLDFGDLTVWKTREGEKHRELLDRVFALKPKAVVFTDIACRYLHLHRERYEMLLGAGTCESYEDYLIALLERSEELWGYTLVKGYMDRWSTVMALVPTTGDESYDWALLPTPDSPVGLELL